jgi:hypothetical protein
MMELLMGYGFIIGLILYIFHKDFMKIDWNGVSNFVGFMALVVCFKLALWQWFKQYEGSFTAPTVYNLDSWRISLVFWEDMCFGGSIFLIRKFIRPLWAWLPMVIAFSVVFGLGHIYQGWIIGGVACLYPYFISYRYGKKYGLITVMACHILYDNISVYLCKLAPYLVN